MNHRGLHLTIATLTLALVFAIGAQLRGGQSANASAFPQAPLGLRVAAERADGLVVSDPSGAPAITRDEAIKVAAAEFSAFHGGPAVAFLADFTDPHYGTLLAGIGGPIAPFYENKLVWTVVIPNATIPLFGARPPVTHYVSSLVVVVDAQTGEYLEAVSVRL